MFTSTSWFSTTALYNSWNEPIYSIHCNYNPTIPYINNSFINHADLQFHWPAEIHFTIIFHPVINDMLVSLVPSRLEWSLSYRKKLYYINDDWHLHPCPFNHSALSEHQRGLYQLCLHDVSAHTCFIYPHLKQNLRCPRWLPIHASQRKIINQDRNVASPYLFHFHLNV